ncbi:DUF2267 domain-containing protein [Thiofilum flexile]|uniref:DUF2267 domain-containing protein n=1 Tax=Thiofilum flexile TaxID=125627 RepID=UPI0003656B9D|nr:DUF2267 domain-containing protein [Thiofilum flexile]
MTWPLEYQKASYDFEHFMVAARDAAGLATTNMAWTMVEGVFHTFRRRLSPSQILQFASVLPPLIRAMFLEGWLLADHPVPFASLRELTDEVQSLRIDHNFSPPNAIQAVAIALRKVIGDEPLEEVLASLPSAAQTYWAVDRDSA